jgi:hypothetical protein
VFDGAAGFDTAVLDGPRAGYAVQALSSGYKLVAGGNSVVLNSIERVQFSDGALAFDLDGVGGQAYRLYQAAFNRVPDDAGLGFWIAAMDRGMRLIDVAGQFVVSNEFTDRYGKLDSGAFLTTVYQNVLHRAPDGAGLDFWLNAMNSGASRAEVLAQFSESPENQAQVIAAIEHGVGYLPYH